MKKKQILIVEDEILVGEFTAGILENAGYSAVHVQNGALAIEAVNKTPPHLILMDIELHGEINGIDTAHEILKNHNIPLIFTTAYGDDETFEKAQKISSLAYLVKPINRQQLLVSVKMAISQLCPFKKRTSATCEPPETLLWECEKKFKGFFEFADIGMSICRTSGEFLRVNKKMCKLLDCTDEELYQKNLMDIIHSDNLEAYAESLNEIFAEKINSFHIEQRLIHNNGDSEWISLKVTVVKDRGKFVYLTTHIQDITDQKRVEKEVKHKIRELNTFVDNVPHMGWLKDVDSNIILANQMYCDVAGMNLEYLQTHTSAECFGVEASKGFKRDDKLVIEGRKKITLEETFVNKDGKEIFLETTKSPIFDDKGNTIGTVGIARDATESKLAEEKIKAALKEKEILLRELHHRVRNNYAMIEALIEMQGKKFDDEKEVMIFQ